MTTAIEDAIAALKHFARHDGRESHRAAAKALARLTAERAAVPPDRERLAARFDGPGYVLGDVKCADVAAALRSPADGWRDIESAPKDGTRILLFATKWSSDPIFTAHWSCFRDSPEKDNWLDDRGSFMDHREPSHWMPIPSPPAEEKTP